MHDVIIAGAGPVGLGLALGLARAGVRTLVLEREEAIPGESRAPLLLPRTLEILRQWQMLDVVRARGRWQAEMSLWTEGETSPRVTFDFTLLSDMTSVAGIVILPQNRLQALLLEAVRPHAEVRYGVPLERFTLKRESVEVHTPAGTFEGRYLVGCDGAHSVVRHALGWELEGKTYPAQIRLADVRVQDGEHLAGPRLASVTRGIRFAVRLEDDVWRVVSTVQPDEPEDAPLPLEPLFGSRSTDTVWAQRFHIHCRTSPAFRAGRVMLAGDAAHINSPAGGMGLNAGLADAHNLAWKLAATLHGDDAEALLDSYDEERHEVVEDQLDPITDRLTRVALQMPAALRPVMGAISTAAMRTSPVQRTALRKMSMLETGYTKSRLISGRGPWLGQRLDMRLEDGRRLLEVSNGEACLLLCDDGRLPAWENVSVPGVRTLRIPQGVDGHAPAALLRPDGHVGWMAMRPSRAELEAGVARALGRRAGLADVSAEPRRPDQAAK